MQGTALSLDFKPIQTYHDHARQGRVPSRPLVPMAVNFSPTDYLDLMLEFIHNP